MNDNFKFTPNLGFARPDRVTTSTLTPELIQAIADISQTPTITSISLEDLDAAKKRANEYIRRQNMSAFSRGIEDVGNFMKDNNLDTYTTLLMQSSSNPYLSGLGAMYSAGGGWEGLKTSEGRAAAANMGLSVLNSNLGSLGNYVSGTDGVRGVNNFILQSPLPPLYKTLANAATAAVGLIDKAGARHSDYAYVNQGALLRRGFSYGNYNKLALDALENNDKEFGLFHGTGSANRLAANVNRQSAILSRIDNKLNNYEALGNMSDLTSLRRMQDINGGYDITVARHGAVLNKLSLFHRMQTKLPCKVDVETDVEIPIIREFKEGGTILHIEEDWPIEMFNLPIEAFKEGGKTEEPLSELKNVIPEGALHAHKHHMEDDKGLTKKGIPVVDGENEQTAEIERNEIIFTLEVTKKLEELAKDGSDEAAIKAGELLVKEILDNTEDRTGLILAAKNGGVLNGNT